MRSGFGRALAGGPRSRWLWLLALAGVVSLVVVSRQEERFREVSDGAFLEIATIEALKGGQLLGPYSRFGWNHPGPLYFYLQAPWYLASGWHTAGMQAGALAINLAAIGVVAFVCLRRLRPEMGASIALMMAVYVIRVPALLTSVWNPHVIILPMIAVVLLLGVFADTGRPALLFGAIVGGSFVVQTHIAMAPLVAVLGIMALVPQRRVVAASAWRFTGLAIALWALPLFEQSTRDPGNLTKLVLFFWRDAHQGQPLWDAINAWAAELTLLGAGQVPLAMGYDFHPVFMPWRLACALGGSSILAVLAVRTGRDHQYTGAGVIVMAAAASVVALVAASRISGQLVDHEVFWISAVGALDAAVIFGALWQRASGRWRLTASRLEPIRWWIIHATVAVSVYLGASGMRDVLHRARTLDDHAVDVIAEDIQRAISALRWRRPLFRIESGIRPIAAGALLKLHKGDQPFAVEADWVHVIGESFRPTGREDGIITISGSTAAPHVTTSARGIPGSR